MHLLSFERVFHQVSWLEGNVVCLQWSNPGFCWCQIPGFSRSHRQFNGGRFLPVTSSLGFCREKIHQFLKCMVTFTLGVGGWRERTWLYDEPAQVALERFAPPRSHSMLRRTQAPQPVTGRASTGILTVCPLQTASHVLIFVLWSLDLLFFSLVSWYPLLVFYVFNYYKGWIFVIIDYCYFFSLKFLFRLFAYFPMTCFLVICKYPLHIKVIAKIKFCLYYLTLGSVMACI